MHWAVIIGNLIFYMISGCALGWIFPRMMNHAWENRRWQERLRLIREHDAGLAPTVMNPPDVYWRLEEWETTPISTWRDPVTNLEHMQMSISPNQMPPDWAPEWFRQIHAEAQHIVLESTFSVTAWFELPQRRHRVRLKVRYDPEIFASVAERVRPLFVECAEEYTAQTVEISGKLIDGYAGEVMHAYYAAVNAAAAAYNRTLMDNAYRRWGVGSISATARAAAEERAAELLRDVLTAAEWEEFREQGRITLPSSLHKGRKYVIMPHGARVEVYQKGNLREWLCIEAEEWGIPDGDVIAAKALMIKFDERNFLKTANHFLE